MYVGLDISKEEIYVGSNLNKSTFKVENNEKGFLKLLEFINSLDSLEAVVMESSSLIGIAPFGKESFKG